MLKEKKNSVSRSWADLSKPSYLLDSEGVAPEDQLVVHGVVGEGFVEHLLDYLPAVLTFDKRVVELQLASCLLCLPKYHHPPLFFDVSQLPIVSSEHLRTLSDSH